jgi:hypothetical protein
MLVEVDLVSRSLCELNTVLLFVHFQNCHADIWGLLPSILSLGHQLEFDFVMIFINWWLYLLFIGKMLDQGFLNEIWVALGEAFSISAEHLLVLLQCFGWTFSVFCFFHCLQFFLCSISISHHSLSSSWGLVTGLRVFVPVNGSINLLFPLPELIDDFIVWWHVALHPWVVHYVIDWRSLACI